MHPPRLRNPRGRRRCGSGRRSGCGSRSSRRCCSAAPAAAPAAPAAPVKTIDAPLVGTFYRAASPEAESFVKVGDTVAEDSVIGIIEAMKVMNEIKAEKSGVIKEILVENGQPVEYGQPLLVIE